ncbi:MAG: hypothetical protein FK733_11485 [Asgard group archaeon]|nr:hypothetical protein [Asgard group archaeon]
MMKTKINYSDKNYDRIPLNVGIDFTKANTITSEDGIPHKSSDEVEAELVDFQPSDRVVRPTRTRIKLGSYIPKETLQRILKKGKKDSSYYSMLEYIRKNEKMAIALNEDFNLLRDFFPIALVYEVQDFCFRIIPKVEKIILEQGLAKLTPRKRRGYVLAIFRSICRKNGRNLTEELLLEINNRFNYQRKIKLFEVSTAENELIGWNLLAKKPARELNDLKVFYLNVVNNINRIKKNEILQQNSDHLKVLSLTQKYIVKFTTDKEKQKTLMKIIKHQDKDFIARLVIWSIAKYYATKELNENFRSPEETPGWINLFLIEDAEDYIPIRSLKFVFWSEFQLRNKLKECKLYPED